MKKQYGARLCAAAGGVGEDFRFRVVEVSCLDPAHPEPPGYFVLDNQREPDDIGTKYAKEDDAMAELHRQCEAAFPGGPLGGVN